MKDPKYRNLSNDELLALEKEFVEFLVINGIQASEWEEIQGTKASEGILTAFSDVIFESIMRNTQFLELWEPKGIKTFQCLPEKLIMVAADLREDAELNVLEASSEELVQQFGDLRFYSTERPYSGAREQELFQMIQAGCSISDGALYKKMLVAMTPHTRG